ncbi:MAG TPA: twin-arginine translocase TatA/TatE family subunit [Candidatus Kapabacteria bacterium]
MFENLGSAELIVIFLVILIFFGPKKIPELAANFGKGLRKFREAKEGFESQVKTAMKEPMEELQKAKSNFDRSFGDTTSGLRQQIESGMNDVAAPIQEAKTDFTKELADIQKVTESYQPKMPEPPRMPLFDHVPAATYEQPVVDGVKIHKLVP